MSALTLEPKSPAESIAVMTQMILPSDANPLNAAFGGRILEWIDICGGIATFYLVERPILNLRKLRAARPVPREASA